VALDSVESTSFEAYRSAWIAEGRPAVKHRQCRDPLRACRGPQPDRADQQV